jgi:hypothetical protein
LLSFFLFELVAACGKSVAGGFFHLLNKYTMNVTFNYCGDAEKGEIIGVTPTSVRIKLDMPFWDKKGYHETIVVPDKQLPKTEAVKKFLKEKRTATNLAKINFNF